MFEKMGGNIPANIDCEGMGYALRERREMRISWEHPQGVVRLKDIPEDELHKYLEEFQSDIVNSFDNDEYNEDQPVTVDDIAQKIIASVKELERKLIEASSKEEH